MGFVHSRTSLRCGLLERDYVIIAFSPYLRKKLGNRQKTGCLIRPEVYLDESYINVNHSVKNTWYFTDDGPWAPKPSGLGQRLIIVNAITFDKLDSKCKISFVCGTIYRRLSWTNEL